MSELKFDKVVSELIATEETYVAGLKLVVTVYMVELGSITKKDDLDLAFSNISTLYMIHEKLLVDLRATQDHEEKAEMVSAINQVFMGFLPFLKMYTGYVNGFDQSRKKILALTQNKKFKAKLEELNNKQDQDLGSYLITPIQRLPRYELLYRDLLKQISEGDAQYGKAMDCFNKIKEINKFINTQKSEQEKRERKYAIQAALKKQKIDIFARPDRKLLEEGQIMVAAFDLEKTSAAEADHITTPPFEESYVVLFDDLFLQFYATCTGLNKEKLEKLKFVRQFDLTKFSSIQPKKVNHLDEEDTKVENSENTITCTFGTSYIFFQFPSEQIKEKWSASLTRVKEELSSKVSSPSASPTSTPKDAANSPLAAFKKTKSLFKNVGRRGSNPPKPKEDTQEEANPQVPLKLRKWAAKKQSWKSRRDGDGSVKEELEKEWNTLKTTMEDEDEDEDEVPEIEAILEQNEDSYLIKWKGYDEQYASWETEIALEHFCPGAVAAFKKEQEAKKKQEEKEQKKQEKRRKKEEEKQRKEEEKKRKEAEKKKKKQEEEVRKEEAKRKKEEEKRLAEQQKEEAKRKKEEMRLAEQKRIEEEEANRKKEEEEEKQLAEQKRIEEEKQRKEEQKRREEEEQLAEQKRIEEEEQERMAEQQRREEEEQERMAEQQRKEEEEKQWAEKQASMEESGENELAVEQIPESTDTSEEKEPKTNDEQPTQEETQRSTPADTLDTSTPQPKGERVHSSISPRPKKPQLDKWARTSLAHLHTKGALRPINARWPPVNPNQ